MTCDDVRDLLPEYVLGTLEDLPQAAVSKHLRGCGACRAEAATLADGLDMVARAHEADPPEGLRETVLKALDDELTAEAGQPPIVPREGPGHAVANRRRRRRVWAGAISVAAALTLIAASLVFGMKASHRADVFEAKAERSEAEASRYETFLGVLGGANVRVGSLEASSSQMVHGSVVVYDSNRGQSWVIALVQAPGMEGTGKVTLSSAEGRTLPLHPMPFTQGGEASTYMVTSSNLREFGSADLYGPHGEILAQADIT